VPAAAPITLRAPRGIADLAIGLAEAPDAEASLDAVMGALRDERPIAAAVTAQAGTYRINLPKVAPGTFRVTVVVPRLWWWDWRGNVTVTAIRSDGAKVTRDIPVEVLW